MKAINWVIGILLLLSLICNGLQFYCLKHKSVPEVIYLHDTVTIHTDSIITRTLYKSLHDTVIEIQLKDTIIFDTIYLPIEHQQSDFSIKKDSLTINETIWHSGYHSTIDSIMLDYTWNYEITKPKPKRIGLVWNIGLYTGYGINFNNGQYYFSPEVGVGGSIGIGGIIK